MREKKAGKPEGLNTPKREGEINHLSDQRDPTLAAYQTSPQQDWAAEKTFIFFGIGVSTASLKTG